MSNSCNLSPRDTYLFGLNCEKNGNISEAMSAFQCAAERNCSEAQVTLANRYAYGGAGIKIDEKVAFQWFNKAAMLGNAEAQNNLGACYLDGTGVEVNKKAALFWFTSSAKAGNVVGQYNLGRAYQKGLGCDINPQLAVHWLKIAAEKNYGPAEINLGLCYEEGKGVEINERAAFLLYKRSSDHQTANGHFNVGRCYQKGIGVKRDEKEALKYFNRAAEKGVAIAFHCIGAIFDKGEDNVPRNDRLAFKFYQTALKKGDKAAHYNLGSFYEQGRHIEKDASKAISEYIEAVKSGDRRANRRLKEIIFSENRVDASAKYELGLVYLEGTKLPQNLGIALSLISKAAKLGDLQAQAKLKTLYYQYASDENLDVISKFELGMLYFTGDAGLPIDTDKAIVLIGEAANKGYLPALFMRGHYYLSIYEPKKRDQSCKQCPSAPFAAASVDAEESPLCKSQEAVDLALKDFHEAADANHIESMYFLGEYYQQNQEPVTSEYWYGKAAKAVAAIRDANRPLDGHHQGTKRERSGKEESEEPLAKKPKFDDDEKFNT